MITYPETLTCEIMYHKGSTINHFNLRNLGRQLRQPRISSRMCLSDVGDCMLVHMLILQLSNGELNVNKAPPRLEQLKVDLAISLALRHVCMMG